MSKTLPTPYVLDRTMHAIFELSRILQQAMTQKLKDDRVNLVQLHVLIFIKEHQGITMKELAQYLKITSPSATAFVNRLVTLKWVRREKDPKNRKLVRLFVTPTGQRILVEKLKDKQQAMLSIFALLSKEDQEQLSRIINHLLASHSHS